MGAFRPSPDLEDFVSFDYGSGVVIGERGEILTAFHVVRGADRLRVRAGSPVFRGRGDRRGPSQRPGRDRSAQSSPEWSAPRLKPVAIGDASRLRKGSFLIALGNPFNAARDGSPSASWGILSNLARKLIPVEDGRSQPLRFYPTLLQLDSKLNLGMSGGAVINLKGELVGLTTTAESPAGFDSQAGYAIPMDKLVRRVVETLKEGKEVEYGLLGHQVAGPIQSGQRGDPAFAGGHGKYPGQ